ncbi:DUF1365 domain-containing protein [Alishewanella longhuensis]|uniref:DUF1365 domain-containing protein n=1 Tax=Alishewanella longhuensis TaxID=1091037 RepID=A0ABQ3KZX0_9ALTE|nr:DUF1365 domain-containing protein [Alishewanella longhuensis]GHG70842.1 DUF1365 domain-containing protein [Alishewanella longhuensis]
MQSGHAVYCGRVGHKRFLPKVHGFDYPYSAYWLDCSQLSKTSLAAVGIKFNAFGAISYRRKDYLSGDADLAQAVRDKVRQLGGDKGITQVFLASPLASWGLYFSPLNLYYCYDEYGDCCYLLAEVSNTPWNERHYYLQQLCADIAQYQHDKVFHVSPFNPLDMQYRWQIPEPAESLFCSITNIREQQAVFSAWFKLQRFSLTKAVRRKILIRQPWQSVQIFTRIYWQALKLLIKRVPVYAHPKSRGSDV